jgi:alkylation response protein AidB-like acyl-CoA dehydrogenase
VIDFAYSDEQLQIVTAVAATLSRTAAVADPQPRPMNAGSTHLEVEKLGALGWIGIALPEACGGSGSTLIEEALIAREYGRWLASPDVIATTIAAALALQANDPAGARRYVEGQWSAAFGVPMAPAAGRVDQSYVVAQADAVTHYVLFTDCAMRVVRAAQTLEFRPCIDPQMKTALIPAASVEFPYDAPGAVDELSCRVLIMLAAMLAGLSEASRDLAVEHAKTRKQFGRVIGAFQAIKHHCADMHVRARMAYSQAMHAAMLLAAREMNAPQQALAAFETASSAAIKNAEVGIQIHGAMGFSAECPAHRYLKRAHVLRIIGGGAMALQPTLAHALRGPA